MVPLSFAGRHFLACPDGALYWPEKGALIVADLHFEKASWFAMLGQFLPPYDSAATLESLEALVSDLQPRQLWCLGDSFHDGHGATRLGTDAAARLARLTSLTDWKWIVGNHDHIMDAGSIGGTVLAEAEVDGLILRHQAVAGEPRPELSGHFHPKLRLAAGGRRVARRCFVATATKLILPAFGSLTGGLDVTHPEIRRATGSPAEALVPVADRLLRFPVPA